MNEVIEVVRLCELFGYGRVMQIANQEWQRKLVKCGHKDGGGAHSVGCCEAFLVKCCDSPTNCDWCCGSGKITKKVAEVKTQLENKK